MDKQFDGHTWCQSNTRNIQNEFDLSFRVARCVGHLRCDNSNCEYLTREGPHDSINEKLWDGHAKKPFLGHAPSLDSTLVCKICKVPPTCLALCFAMMYWVTCNASTSRACIHIGSHNHPVARGDCRESRVLRDQLLQEVVGRSPKASSSSIAMARVVVVLLRQCDDQLKVGLPWMEVHLTPLVIN
jgi:hypothetical protein